MSARVHSQESPALPETPDIETSSDDYARRFAGKVGAWFLAVQESAVLSLLADRPAGRLLDVGGGHGQLTGAFLRRGDEVTVLGSTDACRARIQPYLDGGRCRFVSGDLLDLPFPDRSFGIVASFRLLPHVAQWPRLLSELCRVARHCVIVDYPSVRSVNYVAPQLFAVKKGLEGNTRPFRCFREAELTGVSAACGFTHGGRVAEFFLPMVLHRALRVPALSAPLESVCRTLGLTAAFGSPVVLKLVRGSGPS